MTIEQHPLDGSSLVVRSIALGNGDRFAECMDSSGELGYWIMRSLCPCHEALATHGSVADARHEAIGPLPEDVEHRLLHAPLRCGVHRRDGCPCRAEVRAPGDTCYRHGDHRADRLDYD